MMHNRKGFTRKLTQAKIDKLFQTGRISKDEKRYLENILKNIPQNKLKNGRMKVNPHKSVGVLKPGRPKPTKRINKKNDMKG